MCGFSLGSINYEYQVGYKNNNNNNNKKTIKKIYFSMIGYTFLIEGKKARLWHIARHTGKELDDKASVIMIKR